MTASPLRKLKLSALQNFARRQALWVLNVPRFSKPLWLNVVNRRARQHHETHAKPLTSIQERAVNDLREKGIAVIDCAELFSAEQRQQFLEIGANIAQESHNREQIAERKTSKAKDRIKFYAMSLWKERELDLAHPLVRFSLSDEILGIINGYMELSARLINVDLWYHLPMEGPAVASQNWHRDPTDRKVLKVFFYLRDVDDDTGPFEYIAGSHDAGPQGHIFPRKLPAGVYPPASEVDRKFPASSRKRYTGKAGTIVICDTSGLHRGGHAKVHDRYLYHTYFLSDAAYGRDQFLKMYDYQVTAGQDVRLSPEAEYAVELWKQHTARD